MFGDATFLFDSILLLLKEKYSSWLHLSCMSILFSFISSFFFFSFWHGSTGSQIWSCEPNCNSLRCYYEFDHNVERLLTWVWTHCSSSTQSELLIINRWLHRGWNPHCIIWLYWWSWRKKYLQLVSSWGILFFCWVVEVHGSLIIGKLYLRSKLLCEELNKFLKHHIFWRLKLNLIH